MSTLSWQSFDKPLEVKGLGSAHACLGGLMVNSCLLVLEVAVVGFLSALYNMRNNNSQLIHLIIIPYNTL